MNAHLSEPPTPAAHSLHAHTYSAQAQVWCREGKKKKNQIKFVLFKSLPSRLPLSQGLPFHSDTQSCARRGPVSLTKQLRLSRRLPSSTLTLMKWLELTRSFYICGNLQGTSVKCTGLPFFHGSNQHMANGQSSKGVRIHLFAELRLSAPPTSALFHAVGGQGFYLNTFDKLTVSET